MKSALLTIIVAGVLISQNAMSSKAEPLTPASRVLELMATTDSSAAWRRSMSNAVLAFCNDFSQRLPRNTPKEDEWVKGETKALGARLDANRAARLLETVEYARWNLALIFTTCIEHSNALASGTATVPAKEAALWIRLARALDRHDEIRKQAIRVGVLQADQTEISFLIGLPFVILDRATLPLLER